MDGSELMSEPMQVPDELRPIEPETPEAARQTQARPLASEPARRLEPFSGVHERPPLPK
jgi:hypothetical protein